MLAMIWSVATTLNQDDPLNRYQTAWITRHRLNEKELRVLA
jgi:hypothetical protein